jgi:hypothetical protein
MKYTKSAIGLLTREYRAVLKKCLLINLGLFALGAVSVATPASADPLSDEITNADGSKAIIWNEYDGGGLMFDGTGTENNKITSYVGVHDGHTEGIGDYAQIYVVGTKDSTSYATVLDVNENGMYYTKNGGNYAQRTVANNEIVTIATAKNGIYSGDGTPEHPYVTIADAIALKADASALSNYVEKETGKGLSSNDFTTALKTKLETNGSIASENANFVTGGTVYTTLQNYATTEALNGLTKTTIAPSGTAGQYTITNGLTGDDLISGTFYDVATANATFAAIDHGHANAVASASGVGGSDGFISAADQEKLNGIATGAQVNVIDAITVGGAAATMSGKTVQLGAAAGAGLTTLASAESGNDTVYSVAKANDTFAAIGHGHANAVASVSGAGGSAGFISAVDQEKLNGIATGAQVNVIEAVKLNGTALDIDANKAVNIVAVTGATVNGADATVTNGILELTDSDTTYTAGNGLRLTDTEFSVKAGSGLAFVEEGVNAGTLYVSGIEADNLGETLTATIAGKFDTDDIVTLTGAATGNDKVYSVAKANDLLSLKANAADVYTKDEVGLEDGEEEDSKLTVAQSIANTKTYAEGKATDALNNAKTYTNSYLESDGEEGYKTVAESIQGRIDNGNGTVTADTQVYSTDVTDNLLSAKYSWSNIQGAANGEGTDDDEEIAANTRVYSVGGANEAIDNAIDALNISQYAKLNDPAQTIVAKNIDLDVNAVDDPDEPSDYLGIHIGKTDNSGMYATMNRKGFAANFGALSNEIGADQMFLKNNGAETGVDVTAGGVYLLKNAKYLSDGSIDWDNMADSDYTYMTANGATANNITARAKFSLAGTEVTAIDTVTGAETGNDTLATLASIQAALSDDEQDIVADDITANTLTLPKTGTTSGETVQVSNITTSMINSSNNSGATLATAQSVYKALGKVDHLITESGDYRVFDGNQGEGMTALVSTNLDGGHYYGNLATGTEVARDLVSLDNAVGNLNFKAIDAEGEGEIPTNYLDGVTTVSSALSTLDDQTKDNADDIAAIQANYVTTNTPQTITAKKTFSDDVTVNGGLIAQGISTTGIWSGTEAQNATMNSLGFAVNGGANSTRINQNSINMLNGIEGTHSDYETIVDNLEILLMSDVDHDADGTPTDAAHITYLDSTKVSSENLVAKNSLKLNGKDLTSVVTTGTAVDIATDGTLKPSVADGVATAVATEAAVNATVNNVLDYAYDVFAAKQAWTDSILGITSAHSDAVKEQYADTTYLKDATTLTGADIALDGVAAQLRTDLGDVDFSDALIADVRAATNATDAILALDGYLHIDTGLWNNIKSLKDPEAPHKTATNVGTAIQYLGLYSDSKKLDVANNEKTATIYDNLVDEDNKASFYTIEGANEKFYAKDEQIDGSQIAAGSIVEGSLSTAVVDKLTKATNSLQGIKAGGEDYITLDEDTNKLIIGEIGVDNMEEAAFGDIVANGEKLVKSGVIYSKLAEYKVKDADADEFSIDDDGVLSINEISVDKIDGLGSAATADLKTSMAETAGDASDEAVVSEKAIVTALAGKLDTDALDDYKVLDVDGTTIVSNDGVISVGTIGLDNIGDAAFGAIVANGEKLVKSGTIYTYFQDYAKLGEAANFSSLTLGTAPEGGTLPQATAISSGAKVAAADDLTQADYQTLATNATVRSTVDNAIEAAIGDIDGADHEWTGENKFTEEVTFKGGIDVTKGNVEVDEGDITVGKGDINVVKGDIVVAEGTVQTGSLTLSGKEVTAIDNGSGAVAVDAGSPTTLATTATVIKSAQNAEFSAGENETLPQSINGAGTIHAAIVNVATAVDTNTQGIADLNNLVGTLGTITADYAKTIDATTGDKSDPADIATAIQNVATAAAKADGDLNFTEDYTKGEDGEQADNLTDAINNVAKNAEAAVAGVSAEIHGDGEGSEVTIGDLADKTTIGKVNDDTGLTGIEVNTVEKTVDLAVNSNGKSSEIAMDDEGIFLGSTVNGKSVVIDIDNDGDSQVIAMGVPTVTGEGDDAEVELFGMQISNDEDGRIIDLGTSDGYALEINVDEGTTTFGDGTDEVIIGKGTLSIGTEDDEGNYEAGLSMDKDTITLGSLTGDDASGVKLDATDGSITATGDANIGGDADIDGDLDVGGDATVAGDLSAAGGNFTVVSTTDDSDPEDPVTTTTMTLNGDADIDGDLDVGGDADITGDLDVGGKTTLSAENGMSFDSEDAQTVTGIDNSGESVDAEVEQATRQATLATAETVYAGAENAKYTPAEGETGVTKDAETLHDAIAALDDAMGTMDLSSSETGTFEKTAATDEDPAEFIDNATDALLALDGVVGNIKGLDVSKGNLDPEKQDVASHLTALDARLGEIKAIDGGDYGNLAEEDSDVATHFNSLDASIGDRTEYNNSDNFTGYVAENDGSKDLTTMISEVASNIGTADDIASTHQISAENTVNANLSALDSALGNVDDLQQLGYGNVTEAIIGTNEVFSKAVHDLDMSQRKLRHDFESGMAGQAALSALVPNGRAKGDTQLSIGTGAYRGHTAAAVGGFHWLTDNLLFNAGVAWDNNEATGRMGITYSW